MDCSPPGSSVHGISQARILEWVAISFFNCPACLLSHNITLRRHTGWGSFVGPYLEPAQHLVWFSAPISSSCLTWCHRVVWMMMWNSVLEADPVDFNTYFSVLSLCPPHVTHYHLCGSVCVMDSNITANYSGVECPSTGWPQDGPRRVGRWG